MENYIFDTDELDEIENSGPIRTMAVERTERRRFNVPFPQVSEDMTRGLRDYQIMIDPLQQQQREGRRQIVREMMELTRRISRSSQQPVTNREPGSHRLLHRRNNTPSLKKKPSKLTFMRI